MTRRLLLGFLGVTVLVLLGLEIPFGVIYARVQMSGFTQSFERDAVMLTELAEEEIEEGNLAALPRLVGDYAHRTGTRVTVVDRTGALLTDSHISAPRNADLSGAPDIADALRNRPTVTTRPGENADILTVTMPAASGSLVRGAVRVTASTATVAEHTRRMWLILGLVAVGVLAAAAVIGFVISRWITRPLRALEQATVEFADGVLTDPPDENAGPPELRRLSAAFTHTATRLQHLLQAQHLFAAEASHQLKTPLTALRLRLENLEPDLNLHARASLDDALGEIDRLDRLVHGLLALARLENNATKPQPVDLDAVVAERAETWAAFAAEHNVTITVAGAAAGSVSAVPGAVEQIIDNLLANALRVAPPASTVTIATVPGDPVELHVIDQGPGMTPAQRARACERFWRGDTATDGTGLGLTIVAQLTRSSGGDITLHDAPDSGLDAVVQLRTAHPTSRAHAHPTAPIPRSPRVLALK